MYYGARYYNPRIGRFTSADPVVRENVGRKEFALALANPQLLNSYTYVGNNPLKYVDEEGEVLILVIGGIVLAGVLFNNINRAQAPEVGYSMPSQPKNMLEVVSPWYDERSSLTKGTTEVIIGVVIPTARQHIAQRMSQKVLVEVEGALQSTAVKDAYAIAKAGGKHAGYLENYLNKTVKELKDAIKSHAKNVKEHFEKITNPEQRIKDIDQLEVREIEGIINHWKTDLIRNQQQQNIMEGLLKEKVQ